MIFPSQKDGNQTWFIVFHLFGKDEKTNHIYGIQPNLTSPSITARNNPEKKITQGQVRESTYMANQWPINVQLFEFPS